LFFRGYIIKTRKEVKEVMENLYLREAKLQDMELLFNWANEPSVRLNSVNSHKITWEEHSVWYRGRLESKDCEIYLLMHENTPVGQIRLDCREDGRWISYSVDQKHRGQGFGGLLLRLIEEKIKENRTELQTLWAVVKKDNPVSQKIFIEHSYELKGEVEGNHELLLYRKHI
jgi:RimJ/RimL family protein N-acetyltransferase